MHSGLLSENILIVEDQNEPSWIPHCWGPSCVLCFLHACEVGPQFHFLQGEFFLALSLNPPPKSSTLPSLHIVTCPWDFFISYFNFFTFYLLCVWGEQSTGQKTTSGSPHLWVPGMKLKSLGLVAGPFTH